MTDFERRSPALHYGQGGAPCEQPGMKNGRCRMHGGVFYKRATHGGTTLRAIRERKYERFVLKEMKVINREILGK